MSRADEFNKSYEKPAARYIEWSSDEKQFRYWDKDEQKEFLIPLPFKFVVLMERHTIRGFDDDSNSRIYANEVEDLKTEELTVKSFEGGLIAKGTYSNIKDLVQKSGGHYAKSIYIQTLTGEVWNINLKGSAVFAWGEFVKKDRKQLISHSVAVTSAEELKKGKIDYSIPVFEWGKAMTTASAGKADDAYNELIEKLSARAQSLSSKANDDDSEQSDSKSKMLESLRKGKNKKGTEIETDDEDDDFPDPNLPEEADVDF